MMSGAKFPGPKRKARTEIKSTRLKIAEQLGAVIEMKVPVTANRSLLFNPRRRQRKITDGVRKKVQVTVTGTPQEASFWTLRIRKPNGKQEKAIQGEQ